MLTWALLQLFPQLHVQLLIALLSALLFFFTRTDRYLVASAAITVMALTCFNLIGDGFVLIVPRMVDTVLGCAIAAAAAFLILPDWQGRQLHLVLARVLDTAARYLDSVLGQYRSGMRDDLAYRIARRDMHNADAALSTALSNMLREPGHVRRNLDAGFRFLALSNTLLGHLSAWARIATRWTAMPAIRWHWRPVSACARHCSSWPRRWPLGNRSPKMTTTLTARWPQSWSRSRTRCRRNCS